MVSDKNAELLGGVSLFAGLAFAHLSAIVANGQKVFFESGDAIVRAHQAYETAYLVLSGTVETQPSTESGLKPAAYSAGSLIGEMAILTETVAAIDIVAMGRVRALAIRRNALYQVMKKHPEIAYFLSDKVTERLVSLAHDLHELDAMLASLELSAEDSISALAG
ncbi:MAG: cyclic nucleotide-binding domain-containing protein [Hyphomicrobiales bacterium]|nr:cyclic nucleotide-binding domain-containing protein [Hyphomicrobiales bacterium]